MSKYDYFVIRFLVGIWVLILTGGLALSQTPSPRDILVRFCDLDSQGEQLIPGGWQKVAALFVMPGKPLHAKIIVVRDFVVSRPSLEGRKGEFYVEYIQLGWIDPSLVRFSPLPPVKVRATFYVTKQVGRRSGGAESQVEEWRIAGSVPVPHLTVDAAIRQATELRAKANDAVIKKNADRTLAALNRLR